MGVCVMSGCVCDEWVCDEWVCDECVCDVDSPDWHRLLPSLCECVMSV